MGAVEGAQTHRFEVADGEHREAVLQCLAWFTGLGAITPLPEVVELVPLTGELDACTLCGHGTTEVHGHDLITGEVCLVCWQMAERLAAGFLVGLGKHRTEFESQLGQMVKDVRAGADEPTFYRGFE